MNAVKIAAVDVRPWDVPMRAPYRSAQRLTTTARNVLVTLRLDNGVTGYGESAPALYVTGETQDGVVGVIEAATRAGDLVGRGADEGRSWLADNLFRVNAPGAFGALEMALFDALARSENVPLFRFLGAPEDVVPSRATDLSLPLLPPTEAYQRAQEAHAQGYRALKIKIGGPSTDEDRARVQAVTGGAPSTRLRLDGNQGFATGEAAVRFFDTLGDNLAARVQLLEQPTPAGDDDALCFVAARVPCPVYADEAAKTPGDARRLLESQVCAGVVLKLAKSGISGTLAIARATAEAGGSCLFGCMMETRIGIAAALHVALVLGENIVPDLDLDGHLLVNDAELVQGDGLRQEGDVLHANPALPGLGLSA